MTDENKALLVLYTNDLSQRYCVFHGGKAEFEREWKLMRKHDPKIRLRKKLWINMETYKDYEDEE